MFLSSSSSSSKQNPTFIGYLLSVSLLSLLLSTIVIAAVTQQNTTDVPYIIVKLRLIDNKKIRLHK
jgi:hypothetical protein